ncbi:MAG: hypothetical protein M9939_05290 [Mesorhizobium sp.]|nr:hypothetical protein [Mesorhizobium sp.]MCO5160526.1 hypothetical protein [Mesorhizobium sp.]
MRGRAKTGRGQEVLCSIVSTLLALAALAERAAGDSPWVRFSVLWAARQADLIARDYVAGSTWNRAGRLWSPALPNVRYGTGPADALDIAASLRALAAVISGIAAYLRRVSVWRQDQAVDEAGDEVNPLHGLDAFARRLRNAVFSPPEFRDTS